MSRTSQQFRLPVPAVDTSDRIVEQLAEAARDSRLPSARRGRLGVAVATGAGVALLSVGGAWATGAVNLPGLPDVIAPTPQKPAPTMPDEPRPDRTPASVSPPTPPVAQVPLPSPGPTTRGSSKNSPRGSEGKISGTKRKPAQPSDPVQTRQGSGRDNPGQQKNPGHSQSTGRSEQAPPGLEKRTGNSPHAAVGPDEAPGTSRGKHLGSHDKDSPDRG